MAIKKSDLDSSLWASCDGLRGSMDASQYKDYVLFMLFIGSAPRSGKDIRVILKDGEQELTGPGWNGYSVEEEWAGAIAATVATKTSKLNEPDFRRQDENWLAIYNNVPGPGLLIKIAVAKLQALLQINSSQPDVTFDLVTVESSDDLVLLPSSRILPVVRP
jgi:hypothetical protein